MMLGPMRIRTMLASRPTPRPATAPVVLKRFQKIDSTMTGRFALAATAKANPTRKATLTVCSLIARKIDSAPTTNAVIRATRTSVLGSVSFPWWSTLE